MTTKSEASTVDPSKAPNEPQGREALNPIELDGMKPEERKKKIIARVNQVFQLDPKYGPPGLGLGDAGAILLKKIKSNKNMPIPASCEKTAWDVRSMVEELVKHNSNDSEGKIVVDVWNYPIGNYNDIMKHYNPGKVKTDDQVAKEACESFKVEAAKQRETQLFKALIKTIEDKAGQNGMKRVKKIIAFGGGGIVSHPMKSVWVFQHAFVLELQKIFAKSNSRQIPVIFQDPSYHAIDKLCAPHLAEKSLGGAEVVEDTKDHKSWVALDQETFYISLQTPSELWRLVLEITRPAAFLTDFPEIKESFFKAPNEKVYQIGETYYRIPGTGAPKYTWTEFQDDYDQIKIKGVTSNEKILGWPCLYIGRMPGEKKLE
ncbi:hypothetical protein HYFRA_00000403 [Hymenoscyphus fraxineus]|uniref:SRR1-like domain-containing protein n=1 Tax=Hymenoscyphus fraxineus TaxID=746836 RepID=A0A9N9L2S5_9HELO|nr:hypothetical protein HYFRA_00000403 [Hymenoscyphus fraxineus]